MDLLRELHREGATICMVTHDPRYARHADRTVHLFDGRVVEEDGSRDIEHEMEESGFEDPQEGQLRLSSFSPLVGSGGALPAPPASGLSSGHPPHLSGSGIARDRQRTAPPPAARRGHCHKPRSVTSLAATSAGWQGFGVWR